MAIRPNAPPKIQSTSIQQQGAGAGQVGAATEAQPVEQQQGADLGNSQMEHRADHGQVTGQAATKTVEAKVAKQEAVKSKLDLLTANRLSGGRAVELALDGEISPRDEAILRGCVSQEVADRVVDSAQDYAQRIREEFKFLADSGVLEGQRSRPTPENIELAMNNWAPLRAKAMIANHTTVGFLSEEKLGQELADYTRQYSKSGQTIAQEMFQVVGSELGSNDQAQVATAFAKAHDRDALQGLDHSTLRALSNAINRVYMDIGGVAQMYEGPQNDDQRYQLERIKLALQKQ